MIRRSFWEPSAFDCIPLLHKLSYMKSILYSILLISLAFTYSVDFEDLPSFLNDDTVSEEITRPEFEDFMEAIR